MVKSPDSSLIHADIAERYSVLLDLARALASTLVADELYQTVYDQVSRVLPASAFTIALVEADRRIRPVFRVGESRERFDFEPADLDRLHAGDFVLLPEEDGPPALLAAPLLRETRLLGCLAAERRQGEPFTSDDAHFLLAVGRLAGVAIDNAILFRRLERRGAEAERLERIARDLGATLDLHEVAQRVAQHAHDLAGTPTVVWLREAARMRALARAGGALIRIGDARALPAVLEREYPNAAAEAPAEPGERERPPVRVPRPIRDAGRVLMPLVLGDRLIGLLAVGSDQGGDEPWLPALRRMAAHAASALENARLHDQVRRLSLTDPLVQLPNRRQLDLFLEREFAGARRGRTLCLVLYDLDHFKEYNDAHGHRAGDIALIRFAEVLQRHTRAMNLSARYGGEEFASVLADTNAAGGRALAERVRRRAYEAFDGALTVSAGVAEYTAEMGTPNDLIVAADRALYRAKVAGRNQVHVARA